MAVTGCGFCQLQGKGRSISFGMSTLKFQRRHNTFCLHPHSSVTMYVPNISTATSLISSGKPGTLYLNETNQIAADSNAYARLLQECIHRKALAQGRIVHALIIRTGFDLEIALGSRLINMYLKCERVEDARKVFNKMPERDVVAWTTIITGYVHTGRAAKALGLFLEMQEAGVMPNHFTYSTVVKALSSLQQARWVHGKVVKSGGEAVGLKPAK